MHAWEAYNVYDISELKYEFGGLIITCSILAVITSHISGVRGTGQSKENYQDKDLHSCVSGTHLESFKHFEETQHPKQTKLIKNNLICILKHR